MERKIFDIATYPALDDDATIINLHSEINNLDQQLATKIRLYREAVERVQNNCSHEWKETTENINGVNHCSKQGGHLNSGARNVLVSKSCTKCAKTEIRPKGQPWEICYSCWSPMKFSEKLPSEDRECIYHCTNEKCDQGAWHT